MRELTSTEISKDFVRVPRALQLLCIEEEITHDEFFIVLWLWLRANPVNGTITLSYLGLSEELRQKYGVNHINKLFLSLKSKGLLSYPSRRGKSGAFSIHLPYYPLSSGKFVLSQEKKLDQADSLSRTIAEVLPSKQNSTSQDLPQDNTKMTPIGKVISKTSNNDTDTKKETENIDVGTNTVKTESFIPRNREEQRCFDIAREIGDRDMRFILSVLRKRGLPTIERAFGILGEADSRAIQNKGAYFNTIIKEMTNPKNDS